MAVTMKRVDIWVVTRCNLVDRDQRTWGGGFCFNLQGRRVKIEAENSSEESVKIYQNTRCNVPEGSIYHTVNRFRVSEQNAEENV
jgi:hypothetical protein